LLEKLVDAGRRAPSGRKEEPVEFIVVTGQTDRDFLAQTASAGRFIAQAGACLLVIARDATYYLEDGSAAVQNVLLAATALGLQSCWVAGDKKSYAGEILRRFSVPAGYKLVAMLAIGHALKPGRQPPHRPLAEVLHWEKF
jgi:nitroreductase